MAQESGDLKASLEPNPGLELEPAEIREQMAETRAALADKIEKLEDKVLGTVETAQASVEHTAEAVKETVQGTAATIQRTFDLKYQVDRNPWLMVGGSVLAGYVLGLLATGKRSASTSNGGETPPEGAKGPEGAKRPGKFDEEIELAKGLAIGVAAGLLRDGLKEAMPSLATELEQLANSATRKLGGHPIAGPILQRPAHMQSPGPSRRESLQPKPNGREQEEECMIDGT